MGEAGIDRLDGNRIWRVALPGGGTVLQKFYGERGGALHCRARELATRLRGVKTGTRALARRATEARLLALWSTSGCDVPADLSARHPELANARTLVLEDVGGETLRHVLADPALPAGRRAQLLSRVAAATARRHALARERREVGLVQEHGTLDHALVAGERLVTIDLENGYRPRRDVEALVSKEIAGIVRSLAVAGTGAPCPSDLASLIAGWGDPEPLRAATRRYLRPRGLLARWIARIDRARRPAKYAALEALDAALTGGEDA